ncbi:lipoprotein LpqH [Mycobacterium frederiksbergense]|uniref:lipoprotein LpqH n=1 Tax=Mycolicibacterium frederiksbergense TaxID=117567 RepID=UPI0021F2E979|nr:lipoprotein LpqH [Mycolicibacterium frederiksbergense]MCV7047943.1 lipoprotein LpqH [Mycolicibacterium frederiksbergense]
MDTHMPAAGQRYRVALAVPLSALAVTVLVAGCASDYQALGTHTARVLINGTEVEERLAVACDQVQWVWFIESTQDEPGFTAQVRTGATVDGRLVRLQSLGGFTGSSWNTTGATPSTATDVRVDAEVTDGTFTISGIAIGSYDDDPTETTTADYEIRTDC